MPEITAMLPGWIVVPATAMSEGDEVKVWPAVVKVMALDRLLELNSELGAAGMATVELLPMTRPEEPTKTSVLSMVTCGPFWERVVPT